MTVLLIYELRDIPVILYLLGMVLTFLMTGLVFVKRFIKNANARRVIEQIERVGNILITFMVQAENFKNLSGREKKEYVMEQTKQHAIKDNIEIDEELMSNKIENLITLSKLINNYKDYLNNSINVGDKKEPTSLTSTQKNK